MFTNDDRIKTVSPALAAFAKAMGLDPSPDADGPQTVAGDMICNILHWVAACDPDGEQAALMAARMGIAHYTVETNIDYTADDVDEVGQPAYVEITTRCNGRTWHSETGHDGAELLAA